jgi:hypothetical protein
MVFQEKLQEKILAATGGKKRPLLEAVQTTIVPPKKDTTSSGITFNDEVEEVINQQSESRAIKALGAEFEKLNKEYFVTVVGSTVCIAQITIDPETGRPTLRMISQEGFRLAHKNKTGQITDKDGNTKRVQVADAWLASPNRNQRLGGVAMLPNLPVPPDVYNLYQGFGVDSVPGDAKPALQHIHNVICGGDKVVAKYCLQWMAHCAQRPERPAEVALVMQGGRGSGKGTVARWLTKIFAPHSLQITQSKHLVGNFNGHLHNCLLLFVDEAFFAGDKQGESTLKGLITEPTIAIERKGFDVIQVTNRLKCVMATNSSWAVPAGEDERRFFVVRVSDCHKQDHEYFERLNSHMENGGLAAFLDFLLKMDISNFNIRAVPSTKALDEQKLLSMPPLEAWLYSRLYEGQLQKLDTGWETKQGRDDLCAEFAEFVKSKGSRHVSTDSTSVGMRLRTLIPEIKEGRDTPAKGRKRLWIFPPLSTARKSFAASTGLKHVEWLADVEGEK